MHLALGLKHERISIDSFLRTCNGWYMLDLSNSIENCNFIHYRNLLPPG
jgi:hypothetical protein